MSSVAKIDAFLNRKRVLNETLDMSIVRMIVDALPDICFGDSFFDRMTEMLDGKVDNTVIAKITQVLATELPARAEMILKQKSEELAS